ncbi:hypothetical protein IT568_07945 [bacterium]|nr:hypothetical protein [bacterium]
MVKWKNRGWYLVSEFQKNNSANFEEVLVTAQKLPNFVELIDEKGSLIYRNTFFRDDFLKFYEFRKVIETWKNTKIFVCGNEVSLAGFNFFESCFLSRQKNAFESSEFCEKFIETDKKQKFPDFIGCDDENCIRISWSKKHSDFSEFVYSKYWFSFNKTMDNQCFKISRNLILEKIISATKSCEFCPYFSEENLEELVYKLPDKIKITEDGIWKVEKSLESSRFLLKPKNPKTYHEFLEKIFG